MRVKRDDRTTPRSPTSSRRCSSSPARPQQGGKQVTTADVERARAARRDRSRDSRHGAHRRGVLHVQPLRRRPRDRGRRTIRPSTGSARRSSPSNGYAASTLTTPQPRPRDTMVAVAAGAAALPARGAARVAQDTTGTIEGAVTDKTAAPSPARTSWPGTSTPASRRRRRPAPTASTGCCCCRSASTASRSRRRSSRRWCASRSRST